MTRNGEGSGLRLAVARWVFCLVMVMAVAGFGQEWLDKPSPMPVSPPPLPKPAATSKRKPPAKPSSQAPSKPVSTPPRKSQSTLAVGLK